MEIRELLEDKKRLALVVGSVLAILAACSVIIRSSGNGPASASGAQRFFTVDDGKTTFLASAASAPPFDHKGQQAVRARLFECDGTRFVGYLERYTPEARQVIEQYEASMRARKPTGSDVTAAVARAQTTGLQVKRPGEKDWVSMISGGGAAILAVKCPPGSSGEPTSVDP